MKRTRIFKRTGAVLAAVVVASSALVVGASAHSVDKGQILTFPIPTTPGGSVTLLGNKKQIPRNFSGQAVLEFHVKGQTSDVIVSETAAADDCSTGEEPFIGVDIVGAGGKLDAALTLTGTAQDPDGNTVDYSQPEQGGTADLGPGGEVTEVMAICLDLS